MGNARGLVLSLLSAVLGLAACDSSERFHVRDGEWYFESNKMGVPGTAVLTSLNQHFVRLDDRVFYHEGEVPAADASTFKALDDHYGKDATSVYFADTHRDSKEYFSIKRVRVQRLVGSDAASFRSLVEGYAVDARQAYFQGVPFAVHDVASFEVLDYAFARDKARGYHQLIEIPGSSGASFAVVDLDYAKDSTHAWYMYLDNDPQTGHMHSAAVDIKGVDAASFRGKTSGFAVDKKRVYFKGLAISASPLGFEVLSPTYAKNTSVVLYQGKKIRGADAPTFHLLQPAREGADAADASARYLDGKQL